MAAAHDRRVEAVRRSLREAGLGALLVTHPPNVSYLTGFTGDSSALIVSADRLLIVSDFRFDTQLRDECPTLERHIRPSDRTLPQELGEVVAKLGLGRVGFEAAGLTVADQWTIREGVGSVELEGTSGVVEAIRVIKDDDEIAALRRAIEAAESAFRSWKEAVSPESDEKEAADALEFALRKAGAVGSAFPPIVAVGPRAALPHARPEPGVRLGSDGFVLVDWGACMGPLPYRSDLTRVLATGKVSPRFEELYGVVLEAQRRAIASIHPGAKAADVDAEARSHIGEAGFARFFDHGLGHGIGLEIHEAPRLRGSSEETLRPGMVLTIEPGIYVPDWGGIRIEDDVLVTPDGAEVLSRLPRDLDAARDGLLGR
ncbi:M24 family metallopeptidase [Tautonia sociabilis]|uniref:Aminopeptidase P family protein n=1 Tax=Tautonia sociabilis TaxID=2080755 RepID=A0A432MCF1_9BACT|nr:Xaa-Pro peptidase family protein [Tautonia sociabilis]RUL81813.1 aminopeptidase P family protein [Tautonia sociabilis]